MKKSLPFFALFLLSACQHPSALPPAPAKNSALMCQEEGDGESSHLFDITFLGPKNDLGPYLSENPQDWVFSITSKTGNENIKLDSIRIFSHEFGYEGEWMEDVAYLPGNRIKFKAAAIQNFTNDWWHLFKKFQQQHPFGAPQNPQLDINFHFQDDTYEHMAGYSCTPIFGPNSVRYKLVDTDGKPIPGFKFDIDVNNPGGYEKNAIHAQTNANGESLIKGLPIGTFIGAFDTPNRISPVTYIYGPGKNCVIKMRQDKKKSFIDSPFYVRGEWTTLENTCASLH